MKNKLFLVALATVTVLGPSLATPRHQTVHAANVSPAGTCTHPKEDSTISVCYESTDGTSEEEEKTVKTTTNSDSFLTWLWTTITTWFSSLMNKMGIS
ncbi:TPA: SpoV family signaling peptide [Streptococcus pyogenes]|uniref:SpoV family signaling peptide n=1 Tax=Streptococcus pyogenes TaxID=1314 RepID=UPI00109CB2EF|nr:SpoV family signaling peptide [Streptococcus pyogenes]NAZ55847.1 hypothetical protein [Streptococcus pyogenes]QCK46773.1 hypothetical protein ETT60_00955 [Streptococcus pyogenes]WVM39194.1 hypothetical protein R3H37_00955 [Streptococcus pyogenes]WVM42548.1 hypothetical protein R3H61_00960 [Streptococcus pyogenes]VGS76806.1 Uncharacterised protein [Streptococcus pyogenes]